MSITSPPVLSLSGVHHAYGKRPTVEGLDLALAPGEICCLLGPSGCGKTTVLRCIGGFEPLTGGAIHVDGQMVSGPAVHVPPERRRVSGGRPADRKRVLAHTHGRRFMWLHAEESGWPDARKRSISSTVRRAVRPTPMSVAEA